MRNPPSWNGYEVPNANFENARTQFSTPFDYLDIALDTAIVNQIFNVSGDFLYVDTAFDGVATIELNNEHSTPKAPFKIQAGWALAAVFKQIKVNSTAQAGKKIRLMFSTGERVIPALTGQLQISGTVSTLEDGISYGNSYQSVALTAANTPDTIFTPAANVNGAILHRAQWVATTAAGVIYSSFIAKNAAPTTIIDGDVLCGCDMTTTTASQSAGKLEKPVKIPAGKGLYFIPNSLIANGVRNAIYTLL